MVFPQLENLADYKNWYIYWCEAKHLVEKHLGYAFSYEYGIMIKKFYEMIEAEDKSVINDFYQSIIESTDKEYILKEAEEHLKEN